MAEVRIVKSLDAAARADLQHNRAVGENVENFPGPRDIGERKERKHYYRGGCCATLMKSISKGVAPRARNVF